MRWSTLFRLDPLVHADTHAAPPPSERIDMARHSGRGTEEDAPHAIADLLAHALEFVQTGHSGIVQLDENTYRYVLRLPSGSSMVRGTEFTPLGPPGTMAMVMNAREPSGEGDVHAVAVSVEGTRAFVDIVAAAVENIRAVPGLIAYIGRQRTLLESANLRAENLKIQLNDFISLGDEELCD